MATKRKTIKDAVVTFCLQCMGNSAEEVVQCTATDCPLYKYRLPKEAMENET